MNGDVLGSEVIVGIDPINGVYHDGGDVLIGGEDGAIQSFTIKGEASDDSLFVADDFGRAPKADGDKVDPATDDRFSIGPVTP